MMRPGYTPIQNEQDLITGEVMAIAYSGYRDGQHPHDDNPAAHPSDAQVVEDINILLDHGFRLIRVYDSTDHGAQIVRVIHEHQLPMKVLLGIWLNAEVSNHEGCAWLHEPIPQHELDANMTSNREKIERGIALANQHPDIVVSVNVGNEAMMRWNDHLISLDAMVEYVKLVKSSIEQPVTIADNFVWWVEEGAAVMDFVDYIGVHTYPSWEHKPIDEGLAYTIQNINEVRRAHPGKPIAILEAGWATQAVEFATASVENQLRYYRELRDWAREDNVTVFFFEAFDEPWKGDPNNPDGAEKHWGLFYVDRTPKPVVSLLKSAEE